MGLQTAKSNETSLSKIMISRQCTTSLKKNNVYICYRKLLIKSFKSKTTKMPGRLPLSHPWLELPSLPHPKATVSTTEGWTALTFTQGRGSSGLIQWPCGCGIGSEEWLSLPVCPPACLSTKGRTALTCPQGHIWEDLCGVDIWQDWLNRGNRKEQS